MVNIAQSIRDTDLPIIEGVYEKVVNIIKDPHYSYHAIFSL